MVTGHTKPLNLSCAEFEALRRRKRAAMARARAYLQSAQFSPANIDARIRALKTRIATAKINGRGRDAARRRKGLPK